MSPSFTTRTHFLTLIIGVVALGVSPLTFGISCIWVNATSSFLTLLYHSIILFLIGRQYMRKSKSKSIHSESLEISSSRKTIPTFIPIPTANEKQPRSGFDYRRSSDSDLKTTATIMDIKMPSYPTPSYSPPPYDIKILPNRLYPNNSSSIPLTPSPSPYCQFPPPPWSVAVSKSDINTKNENDKFVTDFSSDSEIKLYRMNLNPFYTFLSLTSNILITIFTTVSFGMTLEVTLNGSKSLLPAEKAKGMTLPWNIKSQKVICTIFATLTLMSLLNLLLCVYGRSRIANMEKDKREEEEYSYSAP